MTSPRDTQADGPDVSDLLRADARPLPYKELDPQQRQAFRRLVTLLEGATPGDRSANDRQQANLPGRRPRGVFLDHARSSRTILVGGHRGTGKTTLLLSLADALTPGSGLPDPDFEPEVTRPLTKQLASLRRRLVWLETLDMEPLSATANLLGAVLARVEDTMGALLPPPDDDEEQRAYLMFPGVLYHAAQREMLRLQTSVALSFDGNLAQRAASLDPDTFAIESRRAERERLGLNPRFAQVLADFSTVLSEAAVAPSQSGAIVMSPIFVLPVDDLDLNPGTAVQLLELLRAVNSPHLLTIVAADLELLSTILSLKYQGELARIITPADAEPEILRKGTDLAINALRKHIPPSHRVVLGLIEPAEALAFAPPGCSDPLYRRLGTARFAPDVLDLLLTEDFMGASPNDTGDSARDPVTKQAQLPTTGLSAETLKGYSWLEILRMPLRTLLDLYLDAGTDRAVPGHQEPALQQLARSRLDELLELLPSGVDDPTHVLLKIEARMTQKPAAARGPAEVRTLTLDGWAVSRGYGNVLDRAEAAAFAGALDLLDEHARLNYPLVPEVLSPRTTVLSTSAGTAQTVVWPWVRHSTFWGYERAFKWLTAAEDLWRNDPDGLFGSWVAVMTAQLFDSPGDYAPLDAPRLVDSQAESPWPTKWDELETWMAQLTGRTASGGQDSHLDSRVDRWLLAVGLLCTPEMGMQEPKKAANLVPRNLRARVRELRRSRSANRPELQGLAADLATPPPATAGRGRAASAEPGARSAKRRT
jgi:energy-coupling factor transporter ATP-binding protein EcfA2